MLRVISEFRPRYVVAENVRGAVNLALDTVYSGLVGEGYKVYPYVIPASAVGAPHQRERLFVVGVREDVANTYTTRIQRANSEEGLITKDGTSRMNQLPNAVKFGTTPKVGGQLNPDWVGQFMGYPEGWTDLDVDEPREWQGWPALLGDRLWGTHVATVSCRTNRFNAGRAMIPVEFVSKGEESSQYPYEFPRTTTGCKNWAKQLKAYGNSVVPAQAYPFFKAIAEIEKITLREVIP